MMQEPAGYPKELERDVTLKNGVTVRIRPIRPDDEPRLVDLYRRLSRYSRYQRFFAVTKYLPPDWFHHFANVDYRRRIALVAERDGAGGPELLAVARYETTGEEETPEVALVVQDSWQGKGLGTMLLNDLLQAAEARGIHRFRAYVLAEKHRMLSLLSRLTNIQQRKTEDGVTYLLFSRQGIPASTTHQ